MTKRDATSGYDSEVSVPTPSTREKPLPWQSPKSAREDREAPARVAATLNSTGYLQADEDVGFPQSDHMRGVGLRLDFSKAEYELDAHDVTHTIVVFGSTRIPEPIAAHDRI